MVRILPQYQCPTKRNHALIFRISRDERYAGLGLCGRTLFSRFAFLIATYLMIDIHVHNETALLESVILGIALSPGPVPTLEKAYDPKSKEFILRGEYPTESDMIAETEAFKKVLEKHKVKVYRPKNIPGLNQIFTRDISFVIGNKMVVPNILKARTEEVDAIQFILDQIDPERILEMPDGARAEGGDVMPNNGKIFVGYSEAEDFAKFKTARTNRQGVEFIKEQFPDWEVFSFELTKSDDDPRQNALHLDCCFQPVGNAKAIMFPGGFKNPEDVEFIRDYFGPKNIIEIDREEMFHMASNVFSISPEIIVSEKRLKRLNEKLRDHGFYVEEVPYYEISKQEGLFRCSTLPLQRQP